MVVGGTTCSPTAMQTFVHLSPRLDEPCPPVLVRPYLERTSGTLLSLRHLSLMSVQLALRHALQTFVRLAVHCRGTRNVKLRSSRPCHAR